MKVQKDRVEKNSTRNWRNVIQKWTGDLVRTDFHSISWSIDLNCVGWHHTWAANTPLASSYSYESFWSTGSAQPFTFDSVSSLEKVTSFRDHLTKENSFYPRCISEVSKCKQPATEANKHDWKLHLLAWFDRLIDWLVDWLSFNGLSDFPLPWSLKFLPSMWTGEFLWKTFFSHSQHIFHKRNLKLWTKNQQSNQWGRKSRTKPNTGTSIGIVFHLFTSS